MNKKNFLMRFWLAVACSFLPLCLSAQFTYTLDYSIPVKNADGELLPMAWTGGLNAPQYNTSDLNGDGTDDLVLFDRMANLIIPFLADNGKYVHAPEYTSFFPEITNFLLLRDYNCDGKKDIFTYDNLGIKVFTNTSEPTQTPTWKQFLFFSGFGKTQVLLSKGFSNKVNTPLQFDDLPSVEDVDGDGDLDLLLMRFSGNGNMELHRNFSKERYGTCDSLDFERVTQAYGNVRECSCGQFAFNGANCSPSAEGRVQHAGGKSLLMIDVNGDSNKDVLISEAECGQLSLLTNQGTGLSPVITSSAIYPQTNPANFPVYPTPYFEDVDFDGEKDLIVTPNAFSKELLPMDLKRSNWFYKNTGTTSAPSFSLQQRDFLQSQMIDIGDNAVPAFFDIDADGDYDMFVSNNFDQNYNSSVYLYRNVGTAADPQFQLLTDDFLGFQFLPYFNRKIQFADVDRNNTIDLVYSATNFETGATSLYYIPNKSQSVLDISVQDIVGLDFQINRNDNVHLVDVDGDGYLDMLIGRSDGSLEHWSNDGALNFTIADEDFLGLGSSILRLNLAVTSGDLNHDGKADLVIGDESGSLQIVSDFRNALDASLAVSQIVFNELITEGNPYVSMNFGGATRPAIVNLFNSTNPAVIVGNRLGGITVLKHDEGQSLPSEPEISIFPNPVLENQLVNVSIDRPAFMLIVSLLGQRVSDPVRLQGFETYQYNTSRLNSGLYIFQFIVGDKTFTRKISIP